MARRVEHDPDVVLRLELGLLRALCKRIGHRESEVAHLEVEMQHHLLRAVGRGPHRRPRIAHLPRSASGVQQPLSAQVDRLLTLRAHAQDDVLRASR